MPLFTEDKTQPTQPQKALILFTEVVFVKYVPFKSQLLELQNNETIKITQHRLGSIKINGEEWGP